MERRDLGHTGLQVPVVGLGTNKVFNVRDDAGQARCDAVVEVALDEDCRLFDTSPMYGAAEEVLAGSLEGAIAGNEALVSTRVWAKTRAVGEEQVEKSLERFGSVSIYCVHNLLAMEEHLPLLVELRRTGRIGLLGASHYLPVHFPALKRELERGWVQVVQVPYHPLEQSAGDELLVAAHHAGAGVVAISPFASGRLLDHRPAAEDMAPFARFGVFTWAQALLKWILSDPRIHAVVPATSNPEHLRENAAAGRPPWFGRAERDRVAALAASLAEATDPPLPGTDPGD